MSSTSFLSGCTRLVDFEACIGVGETLDYGLNWHQCGYFDNTDPIVSSGWTVGSFSLVDEGFTASTTFVVVDENGTAVGTTVILENTVTTSGGSVGVARIHVEVE